MPPATRANSAIALAPKRPCARDCWTTVLIRMSASVRSSFAFAPGSKSHGSEQKDHGTATGLPRSAGPCCPRTRSRSSSSATLPSGATGYILLEPTFTAGNKYVTVVVAVTIIVVVIIVIYLTKLLFLTLLTQSHAMVLV